VAIGVRPRDTGAGGEAAAVRIAMGARSICRRRTARSGGLVGLGAGFGSMPTAYRTAHGEQNAWRLADGSIMRLNTDSADSVRYLTPRERLIEVERGQVLFEAAHDERRRFRVAAGEAGSDCGRHPVRGLPQAGEHRGDCGRGTGRRVTGEPPRGANADASAPRALQVEAGYQVRIDAGVCRPTLYRSTCIMASPGCSRE
jgi:ferric-dicitrate binding protein FerR (iron transport regulator)